MSLFVGDVGVQLKLDAGIDISDYTTLQIKYRKPDDTTGTWTASLSGTQYVVYNTIAGDLDVSGTWTVQIFIVTPTYTASGKKAVIFVEDTVA